ncbi:MAG: crossover junction endodeoxyribonuclease RuvC [Bacteroidales bacterium]
MTVSNERIILGIDPGTSVMGYGLIRIKNSKPELITMGVILLSKYDDHYTKLHHIYTRVSSLVKEYSPTELAIEAPFFGKNVQSMLKLGRAQGVAIAAALSFGLPIFEYAPLKIKMSITGNGAASKEQVSSLLQKILRIPQEDMLPQLDATDGVAAALCHFYQSSRPIVSSSCKSWKDFIAKNPKRVK